MHIYNHNSPSLPDHYHQGSQNQSRGIITTPNQQQQHQKTIEGVVWSVVRLAPLFSEESLAAEYEHHNARLWPSLGRQRRRCDIYTHI